MNSSGTHEIELVKTKCPRKKQIKLYHAKMLTSGIIILHILRRSENIPWVVVHSLGSTDIHHKIVS